MLKTATEIVALLGGTNAAARFFRVQPPSVSGWLERGAIPSARLIAAAAQIEAATDGAVTRQDLRPDDWRDIWPELADCEQKQPAALTHQAKAAIETVAGVA